jgi:aspartate ammonia-lyase
VLSWVSITNPLYINLCWLFFFLFLLEQKSLHQRLSIVSSRTKKLCNWIWSNSVGVVVAFQPSLSYELSDWLIFLCVEESQSLMEIWKKKRKMTEVRKLLAHD